MFGSFPIARLVNFAVQGAIPPQATNASSDRDSGDTFITMSDPCPRATSARMLRPVDVIYDQLGAEVGVYHRWEGPREDRYAVAYMRPTQHPGPRPLMASELALGFCNAIRGGHVDLVALLLQRGFAPPDLHLKSRYTELAHGIDDATRRSKILALLAQATSAHHPSADS